MAAVTPHDDGRMSEFEALMWELERDPQLSSAFANLTVFDRTVDRKRFRARMERAVVAVPRLRQKVVPSPGRLAPPKWRDDPSFDLDHHLRWVDLGGHADMDDLLHLVATLSRQPFDRTRPLWEFVVVEGLADGRGAMVQRLHHTITDGEGGIRLSVQFLDFERDPAPPADPAPEASDDDEPGPVTAPGWWNRTTDALTHVVRERAGQAVAATSALTSAATRPDQLPQRTAELSDVARSALRQVKVDQRHSPLWTERSLGRWFGVSQLRLDEVKEAAHALGGSVNDFFIAGAAAAAGRYHDRAGRPVETLRVSMPVSTRHDRSAGGNAFSPTQSLVPTSEMDPAERLRLVHDALAAVKAEKAIGAVQDAAGVVNLLPSVVVVRTGQRLAGAVDFVCSNVKAAPFDLFIGGAFMEANYPIGPIAGTAFNLTTMSYRGWMFLGLVVDTAAVDDPAALLDDLKSAYAELLRAGGVQDPHLQLDV
ncbi:MAG: wax ester/triacylglycerol synthase domain-containing protein [Actinomycetes bacterium]